MIADCVRHFVSGCYGVVEAAAVVAVSGGEVGGV